MPPHHEDHHVSSTLFSPQQPHGNNNNHPHAPSKRHVSLLQNNRIPCNNSKKRLTLNSSIVVVSTLYFLYTLASGVARPNPEGTSWEKRPGTRDVLVVYELVAKQD